MDLIINGNHPLPAHGTIEAVLGEQFAVGGRALTSVEQIAGDPCVITGQSITFATPGRYEFRVTDLLGVTTNFHVLAVEQSAFDFLPDGKQHSGSFANRRLICRSLAAHSNWDGTLTSLYGRPLANFGG